jgi:hypothetical protein
MLWFLRLFPQYRKLELMVREGGDQLSKMQDQNYLLTKQNIDLSDEISHARQAQITALKMVANFKIQIELGGMPPFPEAYSLPKQSEAEQGPLPTNRVQGRDAVRQGIEDFRAQIQSLSHPRS